MTDEYSRLFEDIKDTYERFKSFCEGIVNSISDPTIQNICKSWIDEFLRFCESDKDSIFGYMLSQSSNPFALLVSWVCVRLYRLKWGWIAPTFLSHFVFLDKILSQRDRIDVKELAEYIVSKLKKDIKSFDDLDTLFTVYGSPPQRGDDA